MKKYAKAIAIGTLFAAGNLAYAVEPVALNAQELDTVSAGVISLGFANATNTTIANAAGSHPMAIAGGETMASAGRTPVAIAAGAGAAGAGGHWPGVANVSSVNAATTLSFFAH